MRPLLAPTLVVLLLIGTGSATQAQLSTSIDAGIAGAVGDFGDDFGPGFTLRGRAGVDLLVIGLHGQVGVTRLSGRDGRAGGSIFQAGVGARVRAGLLFVGANANYYFGDVNRGVGFAPEIGVSFLKLEAVADFRVDGPQQFWGARIGMKL